MSDSQPPITTGPSRDECLWAMLSHLTAFAGFVMPFGNLAVPLAIWLIKKNDMPFVDDQGKESVNFQLTVTLATFVAAALMWVMIGFLLVPIIVLLTVIFVIIATVKANEGIAYRYPICIRFIK